MYLFAMNDNLLHHLYISSIPHYFPLHPLSLQSFSSLSVIMEPYLSFLGSYPSSSSPLQLAVKDHFMHHSNAPPTLLGLMPPEMEIPSAAPPSTLNINYIENNSLSTDLDHEMRKVEEQLKPKTGPTKKMKKPKYAFQTRSHVDILDDGYRWRKYGQKAVKNNKFPRYVYQLCS